MGWEILVKVVVVFVVVNVVVFVVKCIICEFFVRNTVMQYLYVYLSSLDIIYIYILFFFLGGLGDGKVPGRLWGMLG